MVKLVVDVHYISETAKAAGIFFNDWLDHSPAKILTKRIAEFQPYEPGSFYKRELPCIMALLESIEINQLELIIIDGYVYLDDENTLGLGGYLFNALEKKLPVIGVAKTRFYNNTKNVKEITRGGSCRPLFITAIGMQADVAAACIQRMSGKYRIPDLLKLLDRITKDD
jgi:deoxyribonuclease V